MTEINSISGKKIEMSWFRIESLIAILKPIKICSLKLQNDNITPSDFYLDWVELKLKLKEESHDLATTILEHMEQRERTLFGNRAYLACLFLDARCNVLLSDTDRTEAKKHLIQLHINHSQLNSKVEISPESSVLDRTDEEHSESNPLERLIKQQNEKRRRSEDQKKRSIENLLDDFETEELLPRSASILKYWQTQLNGQFHVLASLAHRVFSVCPTQASVERSFSTLRFVLHDLRTRLSDDHLANILLVKTNFNFFQLNSSAEKIEFNIEL